MLNAFNSLMLEPLQMLSKTARCVKSAISLGNKLGNKKIAKCKTLKAFTLSCFYYYLEAIEAEWCVNKWTHNRIPTPRLVGGKDILGANMKRLSNNKFNALLYQRGSVEDAIKIVHHGGGIRNPLLLYSFRRSYILGWDCIPPFLKLRAEPACCCVPFKLSNKHT